MSLGTEVDLGPDHIVLDGAQLICTKKGKHSPQFSAHVYCGRPSQLLLSTCILFIYFKTNDKGRLVPLTCHE